MEEDLREEEEEIEEKKKNEMKRRCEKGGKGNRRKPKIKSFPVFKASKGVEECTTLLYLLSCPPLALLLNRQLISSIFFTL